MGPPGPPADPLEPLRSKRWLSEAQRKAIHLCFIALPLDLLNEWLPWPRGRAEWRLVLVTLVAIAIAIDLIRIHERRVGQWFRKFLGQLIREHERFNLLGSTYLMLAALLAIEVFSFEVAAAALGFTVLGDALAALAGRAYGRPRFFGKSLEGFAAGTLACLAWAAYVALGGYLPWGIAVSGALVASLVELLPIPLDDNLAVTLVAGYCMKLLGRVIVSPRPAEFHESEFDSAVRLARDGRAAEALEAIERAVAEWTDRDAGAAAAAQALAGIARLAEDAGDDSTAEIALALALRLRPKYADLHLRHACVLLRRQRRADARRALDAALRLNPDFLAARVERALLDAREGLVGEALEALRALAHDESMRDRRTFHEGMKSIEHADWDEAEGLLRRALDLDNGRLPHALDEVRSLLEAGDSARAVQALRDLVPRYGAYPDLHALLGRAEVALGHYDDALLSLARALELHPEYHSARVLLAQTLECLGQTEQAQEQIALVLEHDPGHAGALERQRLWAERSARARRRASSAS